MIYKVSSLRDTREVWRTNANTDDTCFLLLGLEGEQRCFVPVAQNAIHVKRPSLCKCCVAAQTDPVASVSPSSADAWAFALVCALSVFSLPLLATCSVAAPATRCYPVHALQPCSVAVVQQAIHAASSAQRIRRSSCWVATHG